MQLTETLFELYIIWSFIANFVESACPSPTAAPTSITMYAQDNESNDAMRDGIVQICVAVVGVSTFIITLTEQ